MEIFSQIKYVAKAISLSACGSGANAEMATDHNEQDDIDFILKLAAARAHEQIELFDPDQIVEDVG